MLTAQPLVFPTTADGWAEPQWLAYWCHTDVPWLTPSAARADSRLHHGAGLPVSDHHRCPLAATGAKSALRALASWRYRFRRYGRPWELNFSQAIHPAVGSAGLRPVKRWACA